MKNKKKQNILITIGTVLVVAIALILVFSRKSSSIQGKNMDFAVTDTAQIQSIFLADKLEGRILLTRQDNSHWLLNKEEFAVQENVDNLLSVIYNIAVKYPVANAAKENVNKWLATGATKVQISYNDYRIKIGNWKKWKYERKKTFYIGSATQDNMGNYAVMEGSNMPVIVYQPGFRGFISPYFSALIEDWKSHQILNLRIAQIKEIKVTDFENPQESLRILRNGEKNFDIFSLSDNTKLPVYDTLKLYDHLGSYRNLNFEFFVNELRQTEHDSILDSKFREIYVEDMDGNKTIITMYYLLNEYDTAQFEYNPDFMEAYNRDKFYITLGDDMKQLYICQYFVFDRIIQPLSYYLPEDETIAIRR